MIDAADKKPRPPTGIWACLRADARLVARHRGSLLRQTVAVISNRGIKAVFLYRVSHWLWRLRVPVVPLILTRIAQLWYAVDIDYKAKIGPGLVIVHGFGLVIGSNVEIEADCCVFHGVTFGTRGSEWVGSNRPDGHPRVGRGCMFGAGAKVLGPIYIAENCVIGANSVVLQDVPPDSVVAGLPAKVISRRPKMDEQLRPIGGHRDDLGKASAVETQAAFHRERDAVGMS